MSIYSNPIYIKLREVYYILIGFIFRRIGMPVTINNFKLRFHPKFYRWFPSSYESDSSEFIKNYVKPGSVCVDIGAHFGLYSIILAKYFHCHVYSFEPTSSSAEVLLANIKFNNVAHNVELIRKAVSAQNGKLLFNIQETPGSVSNSLVDYWHSDEKKNKVEVDVVCLDSFFKDIKYDFLKIDAEGVEYDVLCGAVQTIQEYRPLIILALHPKAVAARGHTLKAIWDMINNLNYVCFFEGARISEQDFCSRTPLFDVFLIHRSQQLSNNI